MNAQLSLLVTVPVLRVCMYNTFIEVLCAAVTLKQPPSVVALHSDAEV